MKKVLTICLAILSGIVLLASVSLASSPSLSNIVIEKDGIRWNAHLLTYQPATGEWDMRSVSLHINNFLVLNATHKWVEISVQRKGVHGEYGQTFFVNPASYAEHMDKEWIVHQKRLSFIELKNEYDSIIAEQGDSSRLLEIEWEINQLVVERLHRLIYNVRNLDEAEKICRFHHSAFDFCQEVTQRMIRMPFSVFADVAHKQFSDLKLYGDLETIKSFAKKFDELIQNFGSTKEGYALQKKIELYLSQFDS